MVPQLQVSRNNDLSENPAIQDVRTLLLAPQCKPLADDVKASGIRRDKDVLKARSRTYMDDKNHILSPLCRLPEDILLAIFRQCLPKHRNPTMHASEAPVLLTNICRRWRSLTLSLPMMWARLHIGFSEEFHPPQNDELEDTARPRTSVKEPIIDKILDNVHEWIRLSRECPLSISIHHEDRVWYPMDEVELKKVDPGRRSILKLFKILTGVAHRWRNIDVSGMPYELYVVLDNIIWQSTKELAMLERLRISIGECEAAENQQDGIQHQQSALKLLNGPNLRSVSLNMPPQWKFVILPLPSWKRITSLNIYNRISTCDLFRILQFCSNLIYCQIFVQDCGESSLASLKTTATLNSLRALVIHESADDQLAAKFYSLIRAPHLRWFHYEKYIHPSDLPPDDAAARPPILSLLQQAQELKKLTIEPMAFSKAGFRYVLEAVPSITHLCVGKETSEFLPRPNSKAFFKRGPRLPPENQFDQERFSLQLLLANKSCAVLLPNMEVFELTESDSAPVPWDDYLHEFINHRMSLHSQKKAAALRHVRVAFDRQLHTDIRGKVDHSAKLAGIDFTLELHYLSSNSSTTSQGKRPVSSPGSDWTVWEFDDIIENYL